MRHLKSFSMKLKSKVKATASKAFYQACWHRSELSWDSQTHAFLSRSIFHLKHKRRRHMLSSAFSSRSFSSFRRIFVFSKSFSLPMFTFFIKVINKLKKMRAQSLSRREAVWLLQRVSFARGNKKDSSKFHSLNTSRKFYSRIATKFVDKVPLISEETLFGSDAWWN